MGAGVFQLLCKAKVWGLAAEQRPLENVQRDAQVCMPKPVLAIVNSITASLHLQAYLSDSAPSTGAPNYAVRPPIGHRVAHTQSWKAHGLPGGHTAWQAV